MAKDKNHTKLWNHVVQLWDKRDSGWFQRKQDRMMNYIVTQQKLLVGTPHESAATAALQSAMAKRAHALEDGSLSP